MPRLRFSHDWDASTTHRLGRQLGSRIFAAISSPRLRMCGSKRWEVTSSRMAW
jgi:hypothetical protein